MKDFDKEKLSTWELDMVTGGAKEPDQEEELRNRYPMVQIRVR